MFLETVQGQSCQREVPFPAAWMRLQKLGISPGIVTERHEIKVTLAVRGDLPVHLCKCAERSWLSEHMMNFSLRRSPCNAA